MLLVVGDPSDPLIGAVQGHLDAQVGTARVLGETTLFEAVPFALELCGPNRRGFLAIDGAEIPLTDLSAVVIRPSHGWWPSEDFVLKDQLFVYNETIAAWFSLLNGLACPVVNRFGLGWWLQDPNYPSRLRADLAARLGCHEVTINPMPAFVGRLLPVPPADGVDSCSVYLAGSRLVPRSADAEPSATRLAQQVRAVSAWQLDHGIGLCRLDFDRADPAALTHVEVLPQLAEEQRALIAEVGQGIAEMLA
jgi:hypothetical protein